MTPPGRTSARRSATHRSMRRSTLDGRPSHRTRPWPRRLVEISAATTHVTTTMQCCTRHVPHIPHIPHIRYARYAAHLRDVGRYDVEAQPSACGLLAHRVRRHLRRRAVQVPTQPEGSVCARSSMVVAPRWWGGAALVSPTPLTSVQLTARWTRPGPLPHLRRGRHPGGPLAPLVRRRRQSVPSPRYSSLLLATPRYSSLLLGRGCGVQ